MQLDLHWFLICDVANAANMPVLEHLYDESVTIQ